MHEGFMLYHPPAPRIFRCMCDKTASSARFCIFIVVINESLRLPILHNETWLLQQLAEGSDPAFREIYAAYVDAIYDVAMVYMKQPELAEDVAQSTFLTVWEKRTDLPSVESFTAWLYTVARNLVLRALRKQVSQRNYVQFLHHRMGHLPAYGDIPLPAQVIVGKETEDLIRSAIERLTPQQRTAFLLHREEGLTYADIGERMGIATNTVRKHIHLALASLRIAIQQHSSGAALFAWALLWLHDQG
jgi:RNA polymerase sigma-70 factor (family 1)